MQRLRNRVGRLWRHLRLGTWFTRHKAEKVVTVAAATSDERAEHDTRSEEHTSELQSRQYLGCRLLLENKNGRREPRNIIRSAITPRATATGLVSPLVAVAAHVTTTCSTPSRLPRSAVYRTTELRPLQA